MLVVCIFNGDNNNNNSSPTFTNEMWRVASTKMGTFHCIVLYCVEDLTHKLLFSCNITSAENNKKTSAAEKRRTFLAQLRKFKSPVKKQAQ